MLYARKRICQEHTSISGVPLYLLVKEMLCIYHEVIGLDVELQAFSFLSFFFLKVFFGLLHWQSG